MSQGHGLRAVSPIRSSVVLDVDFIGTVALVEAAQVWVEDAWADLVVARLLV